jgi:hypothetical protein
MGVDTCAIIENKLPETELRTLAQRLNASAALRDLMLEYDVALRADCRGVRTALHTELWKTEWLRSELVKIGWEADYLAAFDGPFGALRVHEHLAELSLWIKWRPFLTETRLAQPLLKATSVIAGMLTNDSPKIGVFVPDSTYSVQVALDKLDETMPALLSYLQDTFGAPAASLAEIMGEDEQPSHRGYFVARWSDR